MCGSHIPETAARGDCAEGTRAPLGRQLGFRGVPREVVVPTPQARLEQAGSWGPEQGRKGRDLLVIRIVFQSTLGADPRLNIENISSSIHLSPRLGSVV